MNLRQEVVRKIVHVGVALDESGSMNVLNEKLYQV
jgi:CRISPR/Cas system CMR-associated protein Cmr3 (group 5 of RAMP superfamily)